MPSKFASTLPSRRSARRLSFYFQSSRVSTHRSAQTPERRRSSSNAWNAQHLYTFPSRAATPERRPGPRRCRDLPEVKFVPIAKQVHTDTFGCAPTSAAATGSLERVNILDGLHRPRAICAFRPFGARCTRHGRRGMRIARVGPFNETTDV